MIVEPDFDARETHRGKVTLVEADTQFRCEMKKDTALILALLLIRAATGLSSKEIVAAFKDDV